MERRRMLLALAAACVGGAALAQAPEGKAPRLAIGGYDPVAYFTEGHENHKKK